MKPFETLTRRGQVQRLKRLATVALDDFGVPVTRIMPLDHVENTTFRVVATDGRHYAMRITRPGKQNVAGIRSEMMWLAALRRDTDLVVPEPVLTRDGDLLTIREVEGVPEPRICVLFHWVSGSFKEETLTEADLEQVGILTAQLHQHAVQWTVPDGFERPAVASVPEAKAARWLALVAELRTEDDTALVDAALTQIRGVLDTLAADPNAHGLIHADLHQDNYLFHRGQVCAIDFDDCGFGPFGYDLAVTIHELPDDLDRRAMLEAWLRGYHSVRPFSLDETQLDTLLMLRHLEMMTWEMEMRNHPSFAGWYDYGTWHISQVQNLLNHTR